MKIWPAKCNYPPPFGGLCSFLFLGDESAIVYSTELCVWGHALWRRPWRAGIASLAIISLIN